MRLRALWRWLLRCAFGTSCFVGAAVIAAPFELALAPALPGGVVLAQSGPTAQQRPAYLEVPYASPLAPATMEDTIFPAKLSAPRASGPEPLPEGEVIFLRRANAPRTVAVPGNPRTQQQHMGKIIQVVHTEPAVPQAGLGFEPLGLPPTAPAPDAAVTVLHFRRGAALPPTNSPPVVTPPTSAVVPAAARVSVPVLAPPNFPRAEPGPQRRSFVDLSAAPCFAHAPDYCWIVGQVEYSGTAKEWRLRYASVDEVDRFGGRVTLIENQHISYMRDGMYVNVRGHLVNPQSAAQGRAFYRVESFQTVENPNVPQMPNGRFP
jgi:hypothetical protein